MLSFSPDHAAHPALRRSSILHVDSRRGVCFVQGQVLLARSQLRRAILKKHECHSPAPQMLRGKKCKGIFPIKQPAPNIACSGWWGGSAFLSLFLALGFLHFDGESAL